MATLLDLSKVDKFQGKKDGKEDPVRWLAYLERDENSKHVDVPTIVNDFNLLL